MPLSPGDKLGPYEILTPIGAGGMGEVWKARDTRLDRIVAIKRLKTAHDFRFQQEARAIAALNHPHICQIHDVGPDYLVLEYIEGFPLKGPVPLKDALRLASQIASALEAAHARGILHRDLKPANILVNGNGAKLLDFGLAKNTREDDTTTLVVSGTPLYMSPEQAEGRTMDVRSDIFSFGSVLYELLCGRRAFDSLAAVLRDDPAPLESPACDVVAKCLKKQPRDRYASMAEVRAALKQVSSARSQQQPSIAVLPFVNMSGDKEHEYFSDGLAEDVLNLLAKLPALKVIARTSSFAFRGKEQDIRQIGEALNAKTILEGSVRRAGNRIRVTAQLIDAGDGAQLWSERYDRELIDVFEVQDEIAAAIATALHLKLAPTKAAAERYKPSIPGYEAWLKGRHCSYTVTPDSLARAKEYLEQAISLDPGFALPYSELARLYVSLALSNVVPATDAMLQLECLAHKALAIEPSLAQAHSCLAMKAFLFDYDWTEAERQFSLALAEEPAPPLACMDYAIFSFALGCAGRAEERMRQVVEAEPLVSFYRMHLAMIYFATGRLDEAEWEFHNILELGQDYSVGWHLLGLLHLERGDTDEAIRCLEKALPGRRKSVVGTFAGLLARTGQRDRAMGLLAELGAPESYGVPLALALFHLHQGETEAAADWWEKAIDQRDPGAVMWPRYQAGGALRSSPRWPELAGRMNLPRSAW